MTIEVDDVDRVHEQAVELGYEIVHPLIDEPWGVRRFFVSDPDGKVVNVMSPSHLRSTRGQGASRGSDRTISSVASPRAR